MQHTLSHEEYEDLRSKARDAVEAAAALRIELAQAREQALQLGAALAAELVSLARNAIKIVQFAVANMPPEVTKHWPANELIAFAHNLQALPDYGELERDLAIELKTFARDAKGYDAARHA